MPELLNIYNFELWYCFCGDINGRGGQFVLLKIQQKSQTCKVRNASCHFWKIYNSRSLVNRPTGERSWKGRWCFGWVSSNKQWFGIISNKYSSHKCKGTFVPNMLKIFIGQTTCLLFFPMPIVLFRPLFEIFEQEWIPWFELHVVASDTVWCHGKQSVQAVMRHMWWSKRAASSFHIVELALLDTCDQSLDADVFLGVLVQKMVGWGSEVMLQTFFLPVWVSVVTSKTLKKAKVKIGVFYIFIVLF